MKYANQQKIALFGLFGCDNLGNEATLAAVLHGLRERLPDARLVLVSDPPPQLAQLPEHPLQLAHDLLPVTRRVALVRSYRIRTWLGPLLVLLTEPIRIQLTRAQARDVDQLLIAGTGIADDYCQGPFDVPINLQRWCHAVRSTGGKVRFLSVGVGPVSHWLSVRWFRKALQCADYRSYREVSSHQFVQEIGIDACTDKVLPDMVFSLPVEPYLAKRDLQWPPREIGLGVMAYRGWNVDEATGESIYAAYLDKLASLVRELLSRRCGIRLLTGTRGSDQRAVRDLMAKLAPEQRSRIIAPDIQSYRDVLEQIALTDLVIATRFHNVLKALLLERPVISIEYGRKNSDLMNDVGLAVFCHSAETFSVAAVLDQVDQLAAMPAPPLDRVRSRVAEYKAQLRRQFDVIATR